MLFPLSTAVNAVLTLRRPSVVAVAVLAWWSCWRCQMTHDLFFLRDTRCVNEIAKPRCQYTEHLCWLRVPLHGQMLVLLWETFDDPRVSEIFSPASLSLSMVFWMSTDSSFSNSQQLPIYTNGICQWIRAARPVDPDCSPLSASLNIRSAPAEMS